ncbi:MAG: hypothetical protein QOI67_957 [Gaiellaceae bacterium]|nr:hypothetical protein [Gaiellaceae bacterium]
MSVVDEPAGAALTAHAAVAGTGLTVADAAPFAEKQWAAKRAYPRRGWLIRRMLLLADVLGLSTAAFVASAVADEVGLLPIVFIATLPFWVVLAKLYRLYARDDERIDHSTADDVGPIFNMVTVGVWLFVSVTWLTGIGSPSELSWYLVVWATAIVALPLLRASARSLAIHGNVCYENTLIVGAGDVGQLAARKLQQHPEYGLRVVGFVDSTPKERRSDLGDLTVVGSPDRLCQLVDEFDVSRVIVAFSNDKHEETLAILRALERSSVRVDVVPRLFEIISSGLEVHSIEGLPVVGLPSLRLPRSSLLIKRVFDIVVASVLLVILAPLLLVTALVIKHDSPGPVFFRQRRIGFLDQPFWIFKFRTMVDGADAQKATVAHLNWHSVNGDSRMFKINGDPRVTRVGALLRKYSLDELPQLLNVLRGDMTIVGPRPLIIEEDDHVPPWARRRLALKPGITGLWQVLGSSSIPFAEMVKLDYLYVASWSPWNDIRLMLRTLPVLGGRRQIT